MSVLAKLQDPPILALPIAILASSALAGLVLAVYGRTRVPRLSLILLLMLSGAGIGLGLAGLDFRTFEGILNTSDHVAQSVAAIAILAVLTPMHVRVVLGPLGRKG